MRVLNYLELESRLQRSGIGTSARHHHKALADTDVTLLTSPWNGDGPVDAALSSRSGNGVFARFDVAHCHLTGPGSLAVARHARSEGIPLVLHAHVTREDFAGSFRGSTAVGPPLERYLGWFYSLADLVVCPSEYTKGVLESYPVDATLRTVTNGVDHESLSGFEDRRAAARARFDLDGVVVATVGNVFERKGVTEFCRLARHTDYDFAWFGPYDTGPLASPTVRRRVRDPPDNVTFTGWIDDVRDAYAAGDVYCFPTRMENQGIAIMEAMACGKPVVVRDLPVFEEFYTDGVDCLTCETVGEFRAAIDRLAGDPELRERLGENARATARQHGLEAVADDLLDAYRSARRLADEG